MSMLRDSTGRLAASALIATGRAGLYGVFVETDGSHDATLTVYDNTTNSGKILRKITVPGANFYGGWEFPYGLRANIGLYCVLAGAGAYYWVTFGEIQG